MSLDRDSDRPLYKQLADLLRAQILSGQLAVGAALPSKAQLASLYDVSINGVVEPALAELRADGLILMRRGFKTTVLPARIDIVRRYAAGREGYGYDRESRFAAEHGVPWEVFSPELQRRYVTIPAPDQVARLLECPPGEPVVERTWIHRIDSVAVRLAKSYLLVSAFGDTPLCDPEAPPDRGGTIHMLAQLGIHVRHHLMDIGWREANDEERAVFNSAADKGVLEQWRVHMRDGGDTGHPYGHPVETACHTWPARAGKRLTFVVPTGLQWPGA